MARYLALSVLAAVSLSMVFASSAQAQIVDPETETETETASDAEAATATESETEAVSDTAMATATPRNSPVVHPQPTQSVTAVSSQPAQKVTYYGNAILITDLAALGVGTLAVATASSATSDAIGFLLVGAGLTYALGGPIVHATHGKIGTAFGSFGMRLGLPLGGAFVGALVGAGLVQGCSDDWCGLKGAAVGGLVGFGAGIVTASVLDISVLAYEDVPEASAPRLALIPAIDPRLGSAALNLQGIW